MKHFIKAFLRNCLVHPFLTLYCRLTMSGKDEAFNGITSAIIVMNHISFLDAPLIADMVWPVQIRGAVWHEEYARPFYYPFFKLFDSISVGSPKHLPEERRRYRKEKAISLMIEALARGDYVAICPEGGIGDGTKTMITPHFSGLHDLIAAHPKTPLVLVTIRGLEYSIFGRSKYRLRGWWRRIPVTANFRRAENVSLAGGPAGLNKRLEQYFDHDIPLATNDR